MREHQKFIFHFLHGLENYCQILQFVAFTNLHMSDIFASCVIFNYSLRFFKWIVRRQSIALENILYRLNIMILHYFKKILFVNLITYGDFCLTKSETSTKKCLKKLENRISFFTCIGELLQNYVVHSICKLIYVTYFCLLPEKASFMLFS